MTEPAVAVAPVVEPVVTAPVTAPIIGGWESSIPEKFRSPEGKLNGEAIVKSYVELEKMKPVRAPKDMKEYDAWKPPEGVKTDVFAAVREKAFKAGMPVEHYSLAMNEMISTMPVIAAQIKAESLGDPKTTEAKLKTVWQGEEYGKQVALANKAWGTLANESMDGLENHPGVIQLMAKLGAQLGSDPGINKPNTSSGRSLDEIMAHPAYFNQNHAEHESIKGEAMALMSAGVKPKFMK